MADDQISVLTVTAVEEGFEVHAERSGWNVEPYLEELSLGSGLLSARPVRPARQPERKPIRRGGS